MQYNSASKWKYFQPDLPETVFIGSAASDLSHIPKFISPKNQHIEVIAAGKIHQRYSRLSGLLLNLSAHLEVVDVPNCRVQLKFEPETLMMSIYFNSRLNKSSAGYFFQQCSAGDINCAAVENPTTEDPYLATTEDLGNEKFANVLLTAERAMRQGSSIVSRI